MMNDEVHIMSLDVTELANAAMEFRHAERDLQEAIHDLQKLRSAVAAAEKRQDRACMRHSTAKTELMRIALAG